ncbi:MAG: histidine kinase [Chitinophagales bacterium]|nr:histidine kinase [Chitinophagales bacterium]
MSNEIRNSRIEIGVHLLIWASLMILPYSFTVGSGRSWNELFGFWITLLLLAIVFYINYLFLIEKFLLNKKFVIYFFINASLIVLLILIKHLILINFILDFEVKPELPDLPDLPIGKEFQAPFPRHSPPPKSFFLFLDVISLIIPLIFSVAIKTSKRWIKIEAERKDAQTIRLQSELQYLKYQIQPHFFFNSLNNIYALVDKAPDKAKQTLHSLSKLMRHLLRSSDVEKVSLVDEISFLNQYISLMSLRQTNNTIVETHFPKEIPNIEIPPLLFVSIVENAFKHGVSATKPSWLFFEMTIDEQQITFISNNYTFPKNENDMIGSGIGLENLKKRLTLLFENNHTFLIKTDNNHFEVILSFKIT